MQGQGLYKQKIIDNYKKPKNRGELETQFKSHVTNSTCGDELTLYLDIEAGKIVDVKWKGSGCAICIASASILSDKIKNLTIEELESLTSVDILGDMGMEKSSPRFRCATISLEAAQRALNMEGDDPCDFC